MQWRIEERTDLEFLQDIDRARTQLGREVDQVVVRQPLHVERRGLGRERLRCRQFLAGNI